MTRFPLRLIAVAVVLAGCGSTVSSTQGGVASPVGAVAVGGETAGAAAGADATGSDGLSAAPGSAAIGSSTGPAASSSGAGTATSGGAAATGSSGGGTPVAPSRSGRSGAAAPGVTPTTISVGLPYKQNAKAANAAAGANIDPGDETAVWKALVGWVNKHGGIAGRKIDPLYYGFDATTTDTTSQVEEAMCADFTQDHHAFAVLMYGDATLVRCVLKSGAVMAGEDFTINNSAFFQKFPYYIEPNSLNLDRIAANEIPRLVAENYFGAHATVGIVTYDDPLFNEAVDHVMVPALAHAGYAHPQIQRIYEPDALSGLSQEAASIQSAVLKFKSMGVDHVLFLEQSGYIPLLFTNDAESQNYHPRYGFNSQDAPQVLVGSGDMPADQLKDAAGIGWVPELDLPSDPENGKYSNAQRRLCDSIMKGAGVNASGQDAEAVVLFFCDEMLFFKAAVERGGSAVVTRDTFLRGVNSMGTSYVSPSSSGETLFSPTQHDGIAVVHDYVYDGGCGCMSYRGSPHRAV